MHENEISGRVLAVAIRIHTDLGSGLLESAYERVMKRQLEKSGLVVRRQVLVPFTYDGEVYGDGFRLDLLVADKVVVEVKSVAGLARIHRMQVLTYLRLMNLRLGLLINFGGARLMDGYERILNGL